jgi:uncharacterized protein (TIGR02594 family)
MQHLSPNHPWAAWAYFEMARGIKAEGKNPRILQYFENCNYPVVTDNLDWCSAFMSTGMLEVGLDSPKTIVARHWLKWGVPVQFQPGAVVVFWRVSKQSWQGHVAIAVGTEGKFIRCLGGNQNGKVGINLYEADRVLGYRMPAGYSLMRYYNL